MKKDKCTVQVPSIVHGLNLLMAGNGNGTLTIEVIGGQVTGMEIYQKLKPDPARLGTLTGAEIENIISQVKA